MMAEMCCQKVMAVCTPAGLDSNLIFIRKNVSIKGVRVRLSRKHVRGV